MKKNILSIIYILSVGCAIAQPGIMICVSHDENFRCFFSINSDSTTATLMHCEWGYLPTTHPEGLSYPVVLYVPETVQDGEDHTYTVTAIFSSAFSHCRPLYSVRIPNTVRSIGDYAFFDCRNLHTVVLGDSTDSIGNSAFRQDSLLTTIHLQSDYPYLFSTTNKLPASLKKIGDFAFDGCTQISTINIPDSSLLTTIGNSAFKNCTSLTTITIPDSVTKIGQYAFYNCTQLHTVNYNADSCYSLYHVFDSCSSLTTFNIGNHVRILPIYTLAGCRGVTSITIPKSIKIIGHHPFNNCTNLSTVNFNADSATNHGYGVSILGNNTNVSTVNIGSNVKFIPDNLCMGCTNLTSITIPDSITIIGHNPFTNCTSLTTVNYNATSAQSTMLGASMFGNNTNVSIVNIGNNVRIVPHGFCKGCANLSDITIPDSVTSIGISAFEGTALDSVTINPLIIDICHRAFFNCPNLHIVNFNADSSYSYAPIFDSCPNLSSFNIGSNVKRLPRSILEGYTGVRSITIPSSVKWIDYHAFSSAFLSIVNFNPNICAGQSFYCDRPFYGCPNLTTFNIGSNVQKLPNGLLEECTGLDSITIPNTVRVIGERAFYNCINLSSVELGDGVHFIYNQAFAGCTSLSSIVSHRSTAPTIYNQTFQGVRDSVPVYIPCGSMSSYVFMWGPSYFISNFISSENPTFLFVEMTSTEATIQVMSSPSYGGTAEVTELPTCENGNIAVIEATAFEGFHFVGWSDGVADNPRSLALFTDTILIALFDTNYYTLSLSCNYAERGSVEGSGVYAHGTEATIIATANEGYYFSEWSDGVDDNPRNIVVTGDTALTAIFTSDVGIRFDGNEDAKIYPNPTNGILNIDATDILFVEIYNQTGLFQMRIDNSPTINLEQLPTGIYYVQVVCRQYIHLFKIVKRRY